MAKIVDRVEESTVAAGVVYTRPWMVELILDLAGFTADRRLAELVLIEPSAGDGAFLRGVVSRMVESCRRHGISIQSARSAIRAYEIDSWVAEKARALVRSVLVEKAVAPSVAAELAQAWICSADFLEESLGFPCADFVIGNPPYIRLEEIPENKVLQYRNSYATMRGRADIYIAFYQAALQQLKPGGVCAFICADRWLLNDYGSSLRKMITGDGFNVRFVIESHDVDAFESDVSAYPAITVISRENQGAAIVAKLFPGIEVASRDAVVANLSEAKSSAVVRVARFPNWFTGDAPWPCGSPDRLRCLKRLEADCAPLENPDTGTVVGIGVATGADRVFILDKAPSIEADRLLPLALAEDLDKGMVNWSGHYLVNPWNSEGLIEIEDYPRMKAFLSKHGEVLRNRHTVKKGSGHSWHRTIDRVNMKLLPREKLYIADIKDRLLPALDEGRTYPHHNLYWIVSERWDLRALGGLLMSAVGEFFIHCYGVRMRGGYLRFQAQYLRRIRVPSLDWISPSVQRQLVQAFVNQDHDLATKAAMEAYRLDSLPE